jgi:hypothetical protein
MQQPQRFLLFPRDGSEMGKMHFGVASAAGIKVLFIFRRSLDVLALLLISHPQQIVSWRKIRIHIEDFSCLIKSLALAAGIEINLGQIGAGHKRNRIGLKSGFELVLGFVKRSSQC